MSVKVKDVGSYKIHVKESVAQKMWATVFFVVTASIGVFFEFSWFVTWMQSSINTTHLLIPLGGASAALMSLLALFGNVICDPAYYIDTTMYGIGGKTIRKTTPEQDHIAICKVSHEFEMQIIERIKKEEELKEIVGVCK